MNNQDNQNGKGQDSENFASDTVDEQIETLLSAKVPEQHQPAGTRLIHDLATMNQEDAVSLNRIWQHLSAHDAFDKANRRIDETEQLLKEGSMSGTSASPQRKRGSFRRRLSVIAAAACIFLLVGSLAVVLGMTRKANTNNTDMGVITHGLCTPSGKDTTAPGPVVYKKEAGQAGLYVTGGQGIYRFDVHSALDGQLQPLWLFKMNACTALTPSVPPHIHFSGVMPVPAITTGAAVANNMVFFGVNDASGDYLCALHTVDGSLVWKAKININGTPLVLDGLVVVQTADNAGNPLIMALDARNGAVRWSHPFSSSATNQSEGLGSVGDGKVYASASNTIFALDIKSGQQVWSTDIENDQIIIATRFFDGTLYATASSTCFNCEVLPGTSAAYAFNPANGTKQWESQKVAGYLSPPTELQGTVYFGSIDGNVHALNASNGKQIWQSYANGEVRTAPQIANGLVFVEAGRFLDPTKQGTQNGQIDAFDTAGNNKGSFGVSGIELGGFASSISAGQGVVYVSGDSYVSRDSAYLYLVRTRDFKLILRYPIGAIRSGSMNELGPTPMLVS